MLPLQNFLIYNNLVAMNIRPCNFHLVLKQCLSFSQSIYPIICLNRFFKQIQSVSESEIHLFSSNEVQISCGNLCHLTEGGGRVHQTLSVKQTRICSDNWSSCNACTHPTG